ncbi:Auxin efflux carrier [Chlamydiales bacterium STE3]|nr:Auxin efflux carrier [Chlamydiales bacterium STE3]
MPLFSSLFFKILPLYFNMTLGVVASKVLRTPRDPLAQLIFFIINPFIIFNGVLTTNLSWEILSLPFVIFAICSALCLLFYRLSAYYWNDRTRDVLAFCAGSGNTGYFGLPVALLLFNDQGEGVYIMAAFGVTFYDNTIGYYVLAKDKEPFYKTITKLLKVPTIHAFFIGLALNLLGVGVSDVFEEFMSHIKGAYTLLGMMILGLSLANLKSFRLDLPFIGMAFLAKFLIWPIATLSFTLLDFLIFGLYDADVYRAIMLISFLPIGINTVILASLFEAEPEKASTAVLLSTAFALFYVPLLASFFFR